MTEALARISARRPWLTIAVWVLLILIALAVIRALLPSATTTEFRLAGRSESQRAANLMEERSQIGDPSRPSPPGEMVIVQSPPLTVDDPAFRAKVESVFAQIAALGPGIV